MCRVEYRRRQELILQWPISRGCRRRDCGHLQVCIQICRLTSFRLTRPSYRLNILGFPGAPGIQQNVGLLDQRMALEWVRDNIAAFGGDCNRITAFGQSAGSVSIAYQAYAYPSDPIVAGYIMESGTPHSWTPLSPALGAQHWYNASSTLGCGTSGNVLSCMQSKNVSSVLAAFAKVPIDPTAALNQPQFQPVEDNITVFHDYSALAAAGKFAKLVSDRTPEFLCKLLI